jgi:methylated-DNA-[protein]-cysteine S-methyltransferase
VFLLSSMNATDFALFETVIGTCGIAWGGRGVTGTWLPETDADSLRHRIGRRLPHARESAPPRAVRGAIEAIVSLIAGAPADLGDVPLDMDGVPEFHRRVYEIARCIPPGQTLTYGEIARRLGDATRARAVGQALGANPFPILVPCHRVLAAHGRTGGFSASGGAATKLRLLEIEGARAKAIPTLFS